VLVVAPAGAGKSTLLAQLAADAGCSSAWYAAEPSDAAPARFLKGLRSACESAIGELPSGEWLTASDACRELERIAEPLVLCLDDLHLLRGTAAESELERLVEHLPPGVRMLAATRRRPDINLSRLLVAGDLLELNPDDLRFRSWEVEELFREIYGEPLPPDDLAVLARRTEGWAAGLQLFHLACRGRSPAERRRLLAGLGTHFALASEYLARNVLADLEAELSEFLLQTCVLGQLTGELCDELLGSTGSQARLAALAERQVFTRAVDGHTGTYRYHEVLRRHLELELVERIGEADARERFRRAGALLEARGALADAIRAQCRAEDWESVARLAAREGEHLLTIGDSWLDLLPASLRQDDPWLLLAVARRERSAGRLDAAVAAYSEAEVAFGTPTGADLARRERQTLVRFLDPLAPAGQDFAGIVRAATLRDPSSAARPDGPLHGFERDCAAGLGLLLDGRLREAASRLEDARSAADVPPMVEAVATSGLAAALLLSGRTDDGHEAASHAGELADRLGQAWLARLARAVLGVGDAGVRREAASALAASEREGDRWGCALAGLVLGHALAYGGQEDAVPVLRQSSAAFRALGATVLDAWAEGLTAYALARAGDPEARAAVHAAERSARSASIRAPFAFTYLALATLEPSRRLEYVALATEVAEECGLQLPGAHAQAVGPRVALRCLGAFALTVEGTPVDLSPVRPRARQLLRTLALHGGRSVHREVLQEQLWPDATAESGRRTLQVAISALRAVLPAPLDVVREDEAYRLALPPDVELDLAELDEALVRARRARADGDVLAAEAAWQRAVDVGSAGDVLPEDGPAEWVVDERERRRAQVSTAAESLARSLLERGETAAAVAACEHGLDRDRHRDALWRLLISAREQTGDLALAVQARRDYERLLGTLEQTASTARVTPQA
jgi:DNA-binding SARP family transcriptional activator/tetratricopeptide (TPR) repeat protein